MFYGGMPQVSTAYVMQGHSPLLICQHTTAASLLYFSRYANGDKPVIFSLSKLITSGQGAPNKKEGGFNAELAQKWSLE